MHFAASHRNVAVPRLTALCRSGESADRRLTHSAEAKRDRLEPSHLEAPRQFKGYPVVARPHTRGEQEHAPPVPVRLFPPRCGHASGNPIIAAIAATPVISQAM